MKAMEKQYIPARKDKHIWLAYWWSYLLSTGFAFPPDLRFLQNGFAERKTGSKALIRALTSTRKRRTIIASCCRRDWSLAMWPIRYTPAGQATNQITDQRALFAFRAIYASSDYYILSRSWAHFPYLHFLINFAQYAFALRFFFGMDCIHIFLSV